MQPLVERQTHRVHRPRCGFGRQRAGRNAVLVAHVVAREVAERLLAASDVLGLALVFADDLGDVLEAREAVVALHAEAVGHGVGHLRRDDGLHHILPAVEQPQFGPARELVAHEQHEGLVAVQQHVFALLVAQRHADAVRVGVGRQHQVGAFACRQLDGFRHGFTLLGVGRLHGGEVAVHHRLLGHERHVREAEAAQRRGNQPHAGAVQRRVDDLHVVAALHALGRERKLVDAVEVLLVEILAQHHDVLGVEPRADHAHVGDAADLLDDVAVVGGGHLGAVGPVGLVAVVLLGVVRGGDHHARVAFQLADGEAQLGGRAQRVEQVGGEAVRCEDVGHALGELARVVAAVVRHGHADGLAREVLLEVFGQALRGGAHRVGVHAVRACAHDAAQTARTEFQILVEALDELFHIVIHQVFDLLPGLLVVLLAEPPFGFL